MRRLVTLTACVGLLAAGAAGGDKELIWRDGKWVRLAAPAMGTPAGEAALIRQAMDQGKHALALGLAEGFIKRYPSEAGREEVMSLAGDAELARGRYWQAYQWYEKQLAAFPGGALVERALAREMQVAEAFLAGKKRIVLKALPLPAEEEGIDILRKISEAAPGTERAETALLAIGDHYAAKRKWEDAIAAYDGFLKLYPKSARCVRAELAAAEASYNAYRGAMWDETPLLDAEQRYQAFSRRYPAAAQEARVAAVLKEIAELRARKQLEAGRFYDRIGRKDAAAFYYRAVAQEHPETKWAGQANSALGGAKAPPAGATTAPAPGGKEARP